MLYAMLNDCIRAKVEFFIDHEKITKLTKVIKKNNLVIDMGICDYE